VIFDLAAGDLADFVGEFLGVGGVEIAVRPHRREVEACCGRCGCVNAGREHRTGAHREFPSREHDSLPSFVATSLRRFAGL
jgi:hypothetical protein